MTEGTGVPVALTSSRVTVSSLSVTNLGTINPAGNPLDSVRVTLVAAYNTAGTNEYTYSKTFIGTASVR